MGRQSHSSQPGSSWAYRTSIQARGRLWTYNCATAGWAGGWRGGGSARAGGAKDVGTNLCACVSINQWEASAATFTWNHLGHHFMFCRTVVVRDKWFFLFLRLRWKKILQLKTEALKDFSKIISCSFRCIGLKHFPQLIFFWQWLLSHFSPPSLSLSLFTDTLKLCPDSKNWLTTDISGLQIHDQHTATEYIFTSLAVSAVYCKIK